MLTTLILFAFSLIIAMISGVLFTRAALRLTFPSALGGAVQDTGAAFILGFLPTLAAILCALATVFVQPDTPYGVELIDWLMLLLAILPALLATALIFFIGFWWHVCSALVALVDRYTSSE